MFESMLKLVRREEPREDNTEFYVMMITSMSIEISKLRCALRGENTQPGRIAIEHYHKVDELRREQK